jgi:hypothetical protein
MGSFMRIFPSRITDPNFVEPGSSKKELYIPDPNPDFLSSRMGCIGQKGSLTMLYISFAPEEASNPNYGSGSDSSPGSAKIYKIT